MELEIQIKADTVIGALSAYFIFSAFLFLSQFDNSVTTDSDSSYVLTFFSKLSARSSLDLVPRKLECLGYPSTILHLRHNYRGTGQKHIFLQITY